jgi:2-dehydro-3-deoxygalactonokinase
MQHPAHIVSCDWGTSSFRLKLIELTTGSCVEEITSDEGNAALFNKWKTQPTSDKLSFYLQYLDKQISSFKNVKGVETPVIISGMASSSIGMKELPYGNLPFAMDGTSAITELINHSYPILIISGVQQADDVMRGEETQLIGIADQLNLPEDNETLYIFPGTHSKHITTTRNQIIHFRTFMTGEMFDIISRHSILGHAVIASSQIDEPAFEAGVINALESELLSSLFSVRVNQLKNRLSQQANYFYLSGLLIGSEIRYLTQNPANNVVLCSSGDLQQLYQTAMRCAGLLERTLAVDQRIIDNAAVAGHLKIFASMKSKFD